MENDNQNTPSEEEDFYYEGPYVVFTAKHHLKRGYCCKSDCRHCPYKKVEDNSRLNSKNTDSQKK